MRCLLRHDDGLLGTIDCLVLVTEHPQGAGCIREAGHAGVVLGAKRVASVQRRVTKVDAGFEVLAGDRERSGEEADDARCTVGFEKIAGPAAACAKGEQLLRHRPSLSQLGALLVVKAQTLKRGYKMFRFAERPAEFPCASVDACHRQRAGALQADQAGAERREQIELSVVSLDPVRQARQ